MYGQMNDIIKLYYSNKVEIETKKDYYGNNLVETAAWALSRHPIDTRRYGASNSKRDDIAEICKASHDAGLYTKIATNGWFLESNPEFAKYTDLSFISLVFLLQ